MEDSNMWLWAGRTVLLLLLIIADIANGLALVALWCRPALRSPSNRFVVSLLFVNLFGCGALIPLQLLDSSQDNSLRPIICALGEAIASSFCAASILSVLLIVADQYRAVSSPLHYHTPSAAIGGGAAISTVWFITFLIGIGGAVTSPEQGSLWKVCGTVKTMSIARVTFAGVFVVIVLAVPVAALCWLYSAICHAARSSEERARRCSSVSSTGAADSALTGSSSVPSIAAREDVPAPPPSPVPVRRHSCPLPARFRRRMSIPIEARAARVSAAVAVMALTCWTPYSVVLALHATLPFSPPPQIANQVSFAALAASATVSPWLFAYRSRQLRLEIIAVPRRMSRFQVLGSLV